jgi:DNA-binding transcriptional ArsR family regulator
MMEPEEDLYNEIFKALKHPVRRHILSMLQEEPRTYSSMLRALNIDTGLLNYHLENLGSLISKDEEGKYGLSEFGKAAARLKDGVEVPRVAGEKQHRVRLREVYIFVAVLFVALIVGVSLNNYRQMYLREVEMDATSLNVVLRTEQRRLPKLISIVDDAVNNESISLDRIEELRTQTTRSSLLYARIFYVDDVHSELWRETSEAFTMLSSLATDMMVYAQGEDGGVIRLDSVGVARLKLLRDRLIDLNNALFPVNITRDVNPWEGSSYSMGDALDAAAWLKMSISQSYVLVSKTDQEVGPLGKSEALLIESVGRDYYEKYLRLKEVEANLNLSEWVTNVIYDYVIDLGDYNTTCEVDIYFDEDDNVISTNGLPMTGNLMPFVVNRTMAVKIAESSSTNEIYDTHPDIGWLRILNDGEPLQRYVWVVDLYQYSSDHNHISAMRITIEPMTGKILEKYLLPSTIIS